MYVPTVTGLGAGSNTTPGHEIDDGDIINVGSMSLTKVLCKDGERRERAL